jgi:hypothetical protein
LWMMLNVDNDWKFITIKVLIIFIKTESDYLVF